MLAHGILASARQLASLFQHAERARRGRHQESVAACDQTLDIFRVGMGVTAGHVVFFADRENAIDLLGDNRMFVISRVAQLLAQIAFADQHDADAGHFF